MTPFTLDMLTNKEVLAVDQDPLGKQGYPVVQEGPFEVWIKPMQDGSVVAGLFNRSKSQDRMTVKSSHIGSSGRASVRDLWLTRIWALSKRVSAPTCRSMGWYLSV
jgi:alpha-galactosidase